MGMIIGRFKRQENAEEVLQALDKDIKAIEEYRRNTEQSHKRIVGRFIILSVGIYLVTAFTFYFYFFPASFYDRLFYIIPLLLAPVILLTMKRVLNWFYNWKLGRKQSKLVNLRNKKKAILDNVMNNEKYKVAKSILDKYAPELVSRRNNVDMQTPLKQPLNAALSLQTPNRTPAPAFLRQRILSSQASPSQSIPNLGTASKPGFSSPNFGPSVSSPNRQPPMTALPPAGAPIVGPKNILPRDRTIFDKMVDYLVGDGPSNRFALICSHCSSHNGMIFPEEFEYTSFRCCYCYFFNPAKKKRPVAPKLAFENTSTLAKQLSDSSESEKNSPSDSESEPENLEKKVQESVQSEEKKDDIVGNSYDENAEEVEIGVLEKETEGSEGAKEEEGGSGVEILQEGGGKEEEVEVAKD